MTTLVLMMLLASDPSAAPGPGEPLFWKPGMTAPRMAKDNCVGEKLAGLVPTSGDRGEALVKFVVRTDGTVGEFAVMQGADEEDTARVIEAAVRSCEWTPGKDATGTTVAQWAVLPIRYAGDDAAGSGGAPGLTTSVEISPTNQRELGKSPAGRTFFGRLRQDIAVKWDPMSAARSRDPTGERFSWKNRQTILRITLDASGRLVDAQVTRSSGLDFLDQAAVDAVAGAQPFDPPPTELLGEDGKLRFTFGFAVSAGRAR